MDRFLLVLRYLRFQLLIFHPCENLAKLSFHIHTIPGSYNLSKDISIFDEIVNMNRSEEKIFDHELFQKK